MKIRALIVDDEPAARRRLRLLLRDHSDIEITGECGDGRAALEIIAQRECDLVFLDIEMPGMSGVEVVRMARPENMPLTIFVTAYAEYAVRAFEAQALDYLLKPVRRERFDQAMRRVRQKIHDGEAYVAKLEKLLSAIASRAESPRIAIKTGSATLLIGLDAIDWIQSQRDYLLVHCRDGRHITRETMDSIEGRLGHGFLRVHRTVIVNKRKIKKVQPGRGSSLVLLNDTELPVGRSYKKELELFVKQQL